MDIYDEKLGIETVDEAVKDELPLPKELQNLSKEEVQRLEKSLVRRLDWTFLPCITALSFLNHIDKGGFAAAKVAGMNKSLHLTSTQYDTCLMIFYVGCTHDSSCVARSGLTALQTC